MQGRREALERSLAIAAALAAAGLFPRFAWAFNKAAFAARTVPDVLKAYGVRPAQESREVTLTAPEIAENGASVLVGAASTLPGVRHLLVLAEKNPHMLVAKFDLGDAVEANFSLRIKVAESSDLYAVAVTADGRAFYARRDVKVTLGGCGN